MTEPESSSLAEEAFRGQRRIFEIDLERFLTSPATPIEARRAAAIETVRRIGEIGKRLIDQGVL